MAKPKPDNPPKPPKLTAWCLCCEWKGSADKAPAHARYSTCSPWPMVVIQREQRDAYWRTSREL